MSQLFGVAPAARHLRVWLRAAPSWAEPMDIPSLMRACVFASKGPGGIHSVAEVAIGSANFGVFGDESQKSLGEFAHEIRK